jgi:hypothetical protein
VPFYRCSARNAFLLFVVVCVTFALPAARFPDSGSLEPGDPRPIHLLRSVRVGGGSCTALVKEAVKQNLAAARQGTATAGPRLRPRSSRAAGSAFVSMYCRNAFASAGGDMTFLAGEAGSFLPANSLNKPGDPRPPTETRGRFEKGFGRAPAAVTCTTKVRIVFIPTAPSAPGNLGPNSRGSGGHWH